MLRQRLDQIFLIVTLLMVGSVMVNWVSRLNNPAISSELEGRRFSAFSQVKNVILPEESENIEVSNKLYTSILEGKFQKAISSAASDQFPLRIELVKLSLLIDRLAIKVVSIFSPDPAYPANLRIEPDFYYLPAKNAMLTRPALWTEETRRIIDKRVLNYQTLIDNYPNLNFYLYTIEGIEFSPLNPLNPYYPNADAGQGLNYFLSKKPEKLIFGSLRASDIDEYYKFFYKTDHHWDITGIQNAYIDIYQMLKENYPDIPEAYDVFDTKKFEGVSFVGSLARKTLYPISGDSFEAVLFKDTNYQEFINGKIGSYGADKSYLAGKISYRLYENHYGSYHGTDYAVVQIQNASAPDRNLLIISDSYDNALLKLLATQYKNTYSVDFRYYKKFSLSQFTNEHQISDVLVIGKNKISFGEAKHAIQP